MTRRQITLTIRSDGTIQGETHGVYGPECESFLPELEELLRARIHNQRRTEDYMRTQPIEASAQLDGQDDR